MESFFVRYRNLLVLFATLLVQILILAAQVHRGESGHMSVDARDSGSVRLIRLWANALVTPPERLIHSTGLDTVNIWQNYIDLRHVREQNKNLQATVDRLRLEQAALLEDARQGQRLQALMRFQEKYVYKTLTAQVLGTSGTDQSRVVNIDKGKNAGLEHDMAVITPDGIVGKVRDVFPRSAQVLLINDQTSGAGVILETTRIRGILRGNAAGEAQIVGIMADSRIKPGEKVLTAGGDDIFPRGLPVGVVDRVVPDPEQDGFIQITVKPAARLDRLDEVLVITSTQPRFPDNQTQDMAESETLKGAEAAQLNAQKKASEILAEKLPGLTDPNLPADQQPLNDSSNPNPVARPPMALHPDRFTPNIADQTGLPPQGTTPAASGAAPESKPAAIPQSTSPAKPDAPQQREP
ncbi:MAG: rod shape-determining protein MreC [Terracidiphilus sp.]